MRVWQYKIYLVRHLGLPLDEIAQISIRDFQAMITEVDYQRRLEQYPILRTLGQVVCALVNDKIHKYKPADFVGEEPKQEEVKTMVTKDKYEITLGDAQVYNLAILNVNMMEAVEEEFDKSWSELFANTRVKVIKSMLWQMLLPNYPTMSKDQLGKLITTKVLPALVEIIADMSK